MQNNIDFWKVKIINNIIHGADVGRFMKTRRIAWLGHSLAQNSQKYIGMELSRLTIKEIVQVKGGQGCWWGSLECAYKSMEKTKMEEQNGETSLKANKTYSGF